MPRKGKIGISNIRLRRRMVEILASIEGNEFPSAQALLERLVQSGMSPRLIGSVGRVSQLCRTTKGIGSFTGLVTSGMGDNYKAEVYYLESEEAFKQWVDSKTV